MHKHRRKIVGLFVSRRRFLDLERIYAALLAEHRVLERDLQNVLEDHEGLLFDLEDPAPLERNSAVHTPSWAETEEIPVITTVGLDLDKAAALTRRMGLLGSPSGGWRVAGPGTG